ncbi:MAG: topoisomerase C-terminal repeat-containing protein, partial [Bacteroidales bacterium]
GTTNVSLPKGEDPYSILLEKCIDLIKNKPSKEKKVLKTFAEDSGIEILEGMYGPYIKYNGANYKIPKGKKIDDLSFDECKQIIDKAPAKAKKASPKSKTTAKKTTEKKPEKKPAKKK